MIEYLMLNIIPHFFFIAFIVLGTLGLVSCVVTAKEEKDNYYYMVSIAPLSVVLGAILYYGVYLSVV